MNRLRNVFKKTFSKGERYERPYIPFQKMTFNKLVAFTSITYIIAHFFIRYKENPKQAYQFSQSRFFSRITGKFAKVTIPQFMRVPIYKTFASVYHLNLEEIQEPLESFKNFGSFFIRTIHPRPVDSNPNTLTSPADCRVVCVGKVTSGTCLLVKNKTYKLGQLLTGQNSYPLDKEEIKEMKVNKNEQTDLYQCVLYLAPSDYHRFHSPADSTFNRRNHIVGFLKPVKIPYLERKDNVLENNERVSIFGKWVHGFLSMVFVGAFNVGSIDLNFDPNLKTNKKFKAKFNNIEINNYSTESKSPEETIPEVKLKKGEEIGKFNLGSTIVLVFELPKNGKVLIKPGDKLQYGMAIATTE